MLQKRLNSFRFAFRGISKMIMSQPNARIHLVAAVTVLMAGLYFQISYVEWCFVILSITIVLAAEAINTSIESLTNLISPDFNQHAETAKDAAAGAVLLTAIGAAIIGIIIFLPKLFQLINT